MIYCSICKDYFKIDHEDLWDCIEVYEKKNNQVGKTMKNPATGDTLTLVDFKHIKKELDDQDKEKVENFLEYYFSIIDSCYEIYPKQTNELIPQNIPINIETCDAFTSRF